jgi:hypothetical protein
VDLFELFPQLNVFTESYLGNRRASDIPCPLVVQHRIPDCAIAPATPDRTEEIWRESANWPGVRPEARGGAVSNLDSDRSAEHGGNGAFWF